MRWSYQINTFKAAQSTYDGKSKQFGDKGADRNYSINYGRAKELAVSNFYYTFIIAPEIVQIPSWIRLGKWMVKVKVSSTQVPKDAMTDATGNYLCDHSLNPLDFLPAQQ